MILVTDSEQCQVVFLISITHKRLHRFTQTVDQGLRIRQTTSESLLQGSLHPQFSKLFLLAVLSLRQSIGIEE